MASSITETSTVYDALGEISFGQVTEIYDIPESQIISEDTRFYLEIYLHFGLCGGMALFGMVNNICNIIIFHKMGLNDSMSVCLLTLSLGDFLVCFLSVNRVAWFIWDMILPGNSLNPLAIHFVAFGWWRDILFLSSMWVTTFLSIERCVCVVFPFKVKIIFSKFRSIVVVIIIYVVNIGAHMPGIISQWLAWESVEMTTANGTIILKDRLVVKFSDNRPEIQFYIDIANGAVLPMPSQALVVISVVWMIYGLKMSSKIRHSKKTNDAKDDKNKSESNLSSKERRLVRVVLFLAIILTLCNIPRFIAVYSKQIFPNISYQSSNSNLYYLLWNVAYAAIIFNSSVNIFVYLKVNSSYRQTFKELINTCRNISLTRVPGIAKASS